MIIDLKGIGFSLIIILVSCSSSDSDVTKKSPRAKVFQVEQIDKSKFIENGFDSKDVDQAIINTGFSAKRQWFKAKEDHKDFKEHMNRPVPELKSLLTNADAAQATLLVEVLSHKGPTAVSVLIDLLNDKRTAVFKESQKIYWYEEKNKPPQEIELRIFAAMHLERMVSTSPYGVKFAFHPIQSDEGPVEVLYAVKGSYAVNKDDVCKNWLKWWANYGSDYK